MAAPFVVKLQSRTWCVAISSYSPNRDVVPALPLSFAHYLILERSGSGMRRDIVDSYRMVSGEIRLFGSGLKSQALRRESIQSRSGVVVPNPVQSRTQGVVSRVTKSQCCLVRAVTGQLRRKGLPRMSSLR